MTETTATAGRWETVQPWLSTVVRLAMAGILVAAAIPKMLDIPQSIIAVRAYRLLPEAIVPFVGTMLPFFELLLAVFLLAGLFTRTASIVWLVMMAGFVTGVIWAWANGLSIDCGCFGGGGDVAEGTTNYPLHMLERAGFIVLGTYLAIWPRSRYSLDGWMKAA
ncbi:MauE/DoxX family redox-associated membrane protein [Demequina iriomotensis]|uniref:MauE/DoxX family redox-associated membrane protein n=1 Tax=Demequina iriomotensis TaxID=1536641 RepID=UPI0014704A98|nr:MauE/DoxX family redox-associated membrane protein [Demequina iriomotensis]